MQRHPNPAKAQPFETGEVPFSVAQGRLTVTFHASALVYTVFNACLVFLFPWAIISRELGWFGFFEMAFFLLLVVSAFVYAWRKGALEWSCVFLLPEG